MLFRVRRPETPVGLMASIFSSLVSPLIGECHVGIFFCYTYFFFAVSLIVVHRVVLFTIPSSLVKLWFRAGFLDVYY